MYIVLFFFPDFVCLRELDSSTKSPCSTEIAGGVPHVTTAVLVN